MPDLEQDNTILRAKLHWYANVTKKLLVMIKNAADVLEEYEKQVDLIRVELNKTKQVYSKLHTDLQEALNERGNSPDRTELHEAEQGATDEGRGGADS